MATIAVDVREVAKVAVQTSPSGLPASDGGWATQPWLRFDGGSEGCGQVVGEAKLVQDFGVVLPQTGGGIVSAGVAPDIARRGTAQPINGQIVRLLKQDGGPTQIDGEGYTAFWWGRIVASEMVPDRAADANAGGTMTWHAVGLASCLDQITLAGAIVFTPDIEPLVGVGQMPGFNHQLGGERSTDQYTINGASVYVPDLSSATAGTLWTARQALEYVLAVGTMAYDYSGGYLQPETIATQRGWDLSLGSGATLLDWTLPATDLHGLTLLQAINVIITRKRGLTWKLIVDGSSLVIDVYTTLDESLSVGSYTIPESDYKASLVAAGSRWIANLQVIEDRSALANVVELRGAYPWIGVTLAYRPDGSGQLKGVGYGWSSGDETSWQANPASIFAEHVNRLFQVDPAWDGSGLGGEGGMETAASQDGTRSEHGLMPSARMLKGERMLPAAIGWGSLIGGVFDTIGPRQPPVIVAVNGTAIADKSHEWSLQITDNPLAVTIDDGANGVALELAIGDSGYVAVSIGMREFLPLKVWWQDDQANWRTPTPTVKVIQVPRVEKWRVVAGTITGVSVDGSSVTSLDDDLVVRDDTDILRRLLPLAVAWYGQPQTLASWTDRANHDIGDAFAPGRLLTSVQLGDTSIGLAALITRRSWNVVVRDGVRMIDTQYVTERIVPDLEALV